MFSKKKDPMTNSYETPMMVAPSKSQTNDRKKIIWFGIVWLALFTAIFIVGKHYGLNLD